MNLPGDSRQLDVGSTAMRGRRRRSALLAVVLAVVMLVGLAPAAGAHPRLERVAGKVNSDLWRAILSAPLDEDNPYTSYGCVRVDGFVAPFTGTLTEFSCDVRRGQPVLVAGYTVEQSVFEELNADVTEPRDPSPAGLLRRALANLPARPSVTYDGKPLRLVKVTGKVSKVRLPDPNLLGSPDRSTSFVAVGWVTVLLPSQGDHTIVITPAPTPDDGTPDPPAVTTHLHVGQRGHRA